MADVQGGDLSVRIFQTKFSILAKLLPAKKCPKLGIQLSNAEYDNQSCHMLTALFHIIHILLVTKYNIYSSNLFYTNVSISTSLWGGGRQIR